MGKRKESKFASLNDTIKYMELHQIRASAAKDWFKRNWTHIIDGEPSVEMKRLESFMIRVIRKS